MYLWVDDLRSPPERWPEFIWVKSVNEAIRIITTEVRTPIRLISLDHDAGDYVCDGGDYVKLLDWLETSGLDLSHCAFHLHTMNSVGRDNMRRIIRHNGWREID